MTLIIDGIRHEVDFNVGQAIRGADIRELADVAMNREIAMPTWNTELVISDNTRIIFYDEMIFRTREVF